jgi:hypothetical protein
MSKSEVLISFRMCHSTLCCHTCRGHAAWRIAIWPACRQAGSGAVQVGIRPIIIRDTPLALSTLVIAAHLLLRAPCELARADHDSKAVEVCFYDYSNCPVIFPTNRS